jgi:hypothetical protein
MRTWETLRRNLGLRTAIHQHGDNKLRRSFDGDKSVTSEQWISAGLIRRNKIVAFVSTKMTMERYKLSCLNRLRERTRLRKVCVIIQETARIPITPQGQKDL